MKRLALIVLVVIALFAAGCGQKASISDSSQKSSNDTQQVEQSAATNSETAQQSESSNKSDSKTNITQQDTKSSQIDSESKKTEQSTPAQSKASTKQSNKAAADKSNTAKKTLPPIKKESSTFTLLITKNNKSSVVLKKEVKIAANKTLLDYLNENASIEDNGGFITSINGITSVPQSDLSSDEISKGILGKDWFIYVNGAKSPVGADGIAPKKGNMINLDFRAWTAKDLAP